MQSHQIEPQFNHTCPIEMASNSSYTYLRQSYGWTLTQRKGVYGPITTLPTLRPPQGPDVHLPKIVTLRRGNAAARAMIGPLT